MFVAAELIRPLDGHAGGTDSTDFSEGDKVEALYKGKGTKWFSGKISRVNRDGTHDIRYDDGDSESGALKANVRRHPDASRPSSGHREVDDFVEGDKVEALYKGKGTKWFSGKISRVNRDGTYDIRYDDGDSEAGALKSNLRRHPDSSAAKVSLREGMSVEARFRGKERYYPGVIRRENRDGTFDVDYNDVSVVGMLFVL